VRLTLALSFLDPAAGSQMNGGCEPCPDVAVIEPSQAVVVLADWLFTATSVVLQPITGFYLASARVSH
jgi:hypothetical protein